MLSRSLAACLAKCCPPGVTPELGIQRANSQRLHEAADPSSGSAELTANGQQSQPTEHSEALEPEQRQRRKHTLTPRRRAAIASEKSEVLAATRWKSAFEAVRRSEVKSDERIDSIVATLRQHELFSEWEGPMLRQIAQAMREQMVRVGDAVITQGDPGDKFYLVAEGELAAYLADHEEPGSEPQQVCTYGVGGSFGELALLYDNPRAATVRCTSRVALLYSLGRIAFRNLLSAAMLERKTGLERQLATVPLLSPLSPPQLAQLASALEVVEFAAGEYILERGTSADALYLLLHGEVACHQAGESELRLAEHSFFGESALSSTAAPVRQAHVVAVNGVQCARLARADYHAILGPLHEALERAFVEKLLSSIALFDPLSAGERSLLLSSLTRRTVGASDKIIQQGEGGDTFYIVKSGAVEVLYEPGNGQPATRLQTLKGGEPTSYFGERSMLKRTAAVASVVATIETELLCLSKERLEAIMSAPLAQLIDQSVAQRDAALQEARRGPRVPWDELEVGAVLGVGSFGCVRLAVHRPREPRSAKQTYALKGLHKGHLIATNQINNVVNEKTLLRRCHHPFILRCADTYLSRTHVYLLLGAAMGGELFSYLARVQRLSENAASLYVAQVASAFGYLGACRIAHRDLKLENLLFDETGHLKLVDFGFAKIVEDDARTWTFCGTPDYLAPEIVGNKGHNRAVDWWTLGVLAYELLHGEPPFAAPDQMATFRKIRANRYLVGPHCSTTFKELIRRLLQTSPPMRLGMLAGGAADVLSHPFCAHIDVAQLEARRLPMPFVPKVTSAGDTSNFDTYPADADAKTNRKYDKMLDSKHDELWQREFG